MPNAAIKVKTNSTPNSVKQVQLKVIKFEELWEAYPWGKPCTGPYEDQCAARLGVCLYKNGVEGKSFYGARCSVDHPSHMLRAAEVAAWLQRIPFAGCPRPVNITGENWEETVKNKTGIIFFNGYWHRDTDGAGVTSGDHIDLWNGKRLTASSIPDSLATFGRFYLNVQSTLELKLLLGRATYSDLGKSHLILFWEIK